MVMSSGPNKSSIFNDYKFIYDRKNKKICRTSKKESLSEACQCSRGGINTGTCWVC